MNMFPLVVLTLLGGITAGVWQLRRTALSLFDRILRAIVPMAIALVLIMLLVRLAQSLSLDWNEAKLAPVIAMTKGYGLYQNPDRGVMTGWIYGPIGALVMLPAALGRDPTTVVIIGVIIAMTCYLAPVGWLLATASKGRAPLLATIAFLTVAFESFISEDLARCIGFAAPDAVALGLGACSCIAIYRNSTLFNLVLSATAAILCVWTKQNYAPILVALPCWVALRDGSKTAGKFLAALLAVGSTISVILFLFFGLSAMWFHMVELPGHHRWRYDNYHVIVIWLIGLHDLIYTCAASLGLLAAILSLSVFMLPRSSNLRDWCGSRPWLLFILAAFLLIPGGLVGYLKIGGYMNSLACTNFFLLIASMAGLVEIGAQVENGAPARRLLEAAILCFGLVCGIRAICDKQAGLLAFWPVVMHPYQNTQQIAFNYAKMHPEEIYCPWNPLTTLLADGNLYHFEWGIIDRFEYPVHPSAEQYRIHFPPKVNKIVYMREPQSIAAMEVLGVFRRHVEVEGLEGCVVFVQ